MIIVSETAFGHEVADYLCRQEGFTSLTLAAALDRSWYSSETPFVGIVLTGGAPVKLEELTARLLQAGIPHACVVLSDHQLRCGPLVVPGKTACYACTTKRLLSLVETPRTAMMDLNLQRFHEQQPHNALQGFTPALVMMASLRLKQYASLPEEQFGNLTAVSFSSNRTASSHVVALHGCDCRGSRRVSQAQGTALLASHLKGVLQ
ncbi:MULTISPECIES: hypothetical protein [Erwinia]|uniref:hypothetical protein n=1 Tax=Erwinia TaxID=551 RepID=UPI0030B26DE3